MERRLLVRRVDPHSGFGFVLIEPGTFRMGSDTADVRRLLGRHRGASAACLGGNECRRTCARSSCANRDRECVDLAGGRGWGGTLSTVGPASFCTRRPPP
jgi:hypothetical protein